ncbi:MAG: hypothetical protein J6W31_00040 [Clostridia bacterium]|nr:hypothetical protein [Clostridia bacterium]MBQ2254930.1 hypothetical protein [Clostridia bacterium]
MKITMVLSKEILLKFSDHVALSKKFFWWHMGICTGIILLLALLTAALNVLSTTIIICMITIVALDLFYLFIYFVYPRFAVKKAKNLDSIMTFNLEEDQFLYEASSKYFNESGVNKYAVLYKVEKSGEYLYMMYSRTRGSILYIGDRSELEIHTLEKYFRNSLGDKKVKWR